MKDVEMIGRYIKAKIDIVEIERRMIGRRASSISIPVEMAYKMAEVLRVEE